MATFSNDEMDNQELQRLLRSGQVTNTVQPGMEEPQGIATPPPVANAQGGGSTPSPTNIQAPVEPTETKVQDQSSGPDTSKWDTDGYAAPKYTAKNAGGFMDGYNEKKWNDPNHQTPKYVVGRIMQEAAGGAGNLADPEKRAAAIAKVQEAYPGAVYNGKDKITLPTGEVLDVFKGASAGEYGITWQTLTDREGNPLPDQSQQGPSGMPGVGGTSTERINSLVPTDTGTYQELMKRIQGILGPQASGDRDALMSILGE